MTALVARTAESNQDEVAKGSQDDPSSHNRAELTSTQSGASNIPQDFHGSRVRLHQDECLIRLRSFPSEVFDSIVTDPPYALVSIVKRFGSEKSSACKVKAGGTGAYARASSGFMGQTWDTGETAFAVEFWSEVLRVLKPGGHLVAFGGTRTYHRLACAIEDAGFEVRDQLGWAYGTGFPKSHDVAVQLEKTLARKVVRVEARDGVPVKVAVWVYLDDGQPIAREAPFRHPLANQWAGFGTAIKPAWEPICLARKPLIGSVAENVAAYGVGAINIDGCRIPGEVRSVPQPAFGSPTGNVYGFQAGEGRNGSMSAAPLGRFPANILHDGSAEVVALFPEARSAGIYGNERNVSEGMFGTRTGGATFDDTGSAARFFYSAKASKLDRLGSLHPTVKPVDLMRWLVRLVTPPGGLVLDPFAGSGTTGHAAVCEGMRAVLIEREPKFCRDIARRMERMDPNGQPKHRKKPARPRPPDPWAGTLFAKPSQADTQSKVAETSCAARQNRATLATQAQPSKLAPTTDSTSGAPDDSRAVPEVLHAAE